MSCGLYASVRKYAPTWQFFDGPRHRLNIARGDDLLNVFRQGFPHPRAHIRSFFGCLAQFSAALIFFPTTPLPVRRRRLTYLGTCQASFF